MRSACHEVVSSINFMCTVPKLEWCLIGHNCTKTSLKAKGLFGSLYGKLYNKHKHSIFHVIWIKKPLPKNAF